MGQSTNIPVNSILTTKEFQDFLTAAKNFCSFAESQHCNTPKGFLLLTQNHLLKLYPLAQSLSDISSQNRIKDEIEFPRETFTDTIQFIGQRISDQYYWHVFDPTDETEIEAVCGDLVDDLGDIYIDIKRSLLLLDKDNIESKENAIWEFKFYFAHHWGDHCINALYAIHYFLQKNK